MTQAAAHFAGFFNDMKAIMDQLDTTVLNNQVTALSQLRDRAGRLFILGVCGQCQSCCK